MANCQYSPLPTRHSPQSRASAPSAAASSSSLSPFENKQTYHTMRPPRQRMSGRSSTPFEAGTHLAASAICLGELDGPVDIAEEEIHRVG